MGIHTHGIHALTLNTDKTPDSSGLGRGVTLETVSVLWDKILSPIRH